MEVELAAAVELVEGATRSEVFGLNLCPAAEGVFDLHEADLGELLLEFGSDLLVVGLG